MQTRENSTLETNLVDGIEDDDDGREMEEPKRKKREKGRTDAGSISMTIDCSASFSLVLAVAADADAFRLGTTVMLTFSPRAFSACKSLELMEPAADASSSTWNMRSVCLIFSRFAFVFTRIKSLTTTASTVSTN